MQKAVRNQNQSFTGSGEMGKEFVKVENTSKLWQFVGECLTPSFSSFRVVILEVGISPIP